MLTTNQQIFEQIKNSDNILITFSRNWDGDSIGSALALFLFLKKLEKNVEIVTQKEKKESAMQKKAKSFSFLPSFCEIKNNLENLRKFIISLDTTNAKVQQIKYRAKKSTLDFIISPKEGFFTHEDISSSTSGFKYDLIIVLDSPDLESLGPIYDNDTEFFYKIPIINIDHRANNEKFGQINMVELTAVATAEILFSLFESYSRDLIDEDIATCLLAGIIFKTNSFKTKNITPGILLSTSELISIGARREEIVQRLYRSRKLNVLKLWGRVLAKLKGELGDRLVWSNLSPIDFLKTNSNEEDLNDVIDELILNIPQAEVIIIMYRDEHSTLRHQVKLIIYSAKNIDSLDLIREYNPRGDKKLAWTNIDKTVYDEEDIINSVKKKLSKLLA